MTRQLPVGLEIKLFGTFEVRLNGALAAGLQVRDAERLLVLLTLNTGRMMQSATLASTLWPQTGSLDSLRQSINYLRSLLGEHAVRLETSKGGVLLNLDGADVDVLAFDLAVRSEDAEGLKQALALCRGPLLANWEEKHPEDQHWVVRARDKRRDMRKDALKKLAQHLLTSGEHAEAVGYLQQYVSANPSEEWGWRSLMQALADSGERVAAINTYIKCRDLFQSRFQLAPPAEMTRLYHSIKQGTNHEPHSVPEAGARLDPVAGAIPLDSAYCLVPAADGEVQAAIARREMIPDDLRRQCRANRMGLFRAASISAVLVILIGAFGWRAYRRVSPVNTNDFSAADLGPVSVIPKSIWLNNSGLALLTYKDKPAALLGVNSKTLSPLTDELCLAAISDSGIVAGWDRSIDNNKGHPIVWFNMKAGQGPTTQVIPYEASHGTVIMNSKGHFLFDNHPPDATDPALLAKWCVYDPAVPGIVVTGPNDLDDPQFNAQDEIFGSTADGVIIKYAHGMETPVSGIKGVLRGITDRGDILIENVGTQTCYMNSGSLASQTIPRFDCSAPAPPYILRFMNNDGYIIGRYASKPLLWSGLTRTRYDMRVTDDWIVDSLGSINDNDQILALGAKARGPMHFLLIQINEQGVRR